VFVYVFEIFYLLILVQNKRFNILVPEKQKCSSQKKIPAGNVLSFTFSSASRLKIQNGVERPSNSSIVTLHDVDEKSIIDRHFQTSF
jgi:hypothetical protein